MGDEQQRRIDNRRGLTFIPNARPLPQFVRPLLDFPRRAAAFALFVERFETRLCSNWICSTIQSSSRRRSAGCPRVCGGEGKRRGPDKTAERAFFLFAQQAADARGIGHGLRRPSIFRKQRSHSF